MRFKRTRTIVFLAVTLPAAAGCVQKNIPNTTIPDTSFNRKVIKFCEQYRLAVESKNVGKILMMTSPDYYEDGGTPTGEDDFDYSQLRDILTSRFSKIKTIRYDIKYRKVEIKEDDLVHVDYTWSGSYQVQGGSGQDHWFRKVEDNRLVLIEYKDSFKILSGM
jgi:hypothetical protein